MKLYHYDYITIVKMSENFTLVNIINVVLNCIRF